MTEAASPAFAFRSRRSVLRFVGIYGVSRGLGFLREVGIAYLFGTSAAADRLNVAFVVASLATIIGGEAVYASTIRSLSDPAPGTGDFRALMGASFRLAVIGTLLFAVAAPPVALLMAGKSGDDDTAQLVILVLCLAPSVGAGIAAGAANGKLTLDGRIGRMNVAQLCYSAGAITGLVFIGLTDAGPAVVAVGWSAGNLVGLLVLYRAVRPGRAARSATRPSALAMLLTGLPVAVAFALIALQSVTDRVIAGRLDVGDIAALGYADRLFLIPTGFVFGFFAPAVLGSIAATAASGRVEVGADAADKLRRLVQWTVPATLLAVGASPLLVHILFEYGAFDAHSADATIAAFDGLAAGIAATSLSLVLLRVMQAVLPLRTLAAVAVIAVVVNAIASLLLSSWFGLYGVAVGTSLTSCCSAAIQVAILARRFDPSWGRTVALGCVLPVVAAFGAAAAVGVAATADATTTVPRTALAAAGVVWLAMLARNVSR